MKKCMVFALLSAASGLAQTAPSLSAQDATAPAVGARRVPEKVKGPTPHLADGTVDLSGIWSGGGPIANIAQGMPKGEKIPMLPSAEKILNSRQSKDDPEANC